MKFFAPSLTYQERLKKEFLFGFFLLTGIILYSTYNSEASFEIIGLVIILTGLTLFLTIHLKAAIFYNQIEISESDLILKGFDVNKPLEVRLPIADTNIVLKVQASRSGNHQYYLWFEHNNKKYIINRLFNWNYAELLELFYAFKNAKSEKVIYDEKYILERIQKKIDDSQHHTSIHADDC
ncbi:MAG: hypothetical protein OCD76_21460 [Reichenbachiella sp.]